MAQGYGGTAGGHGVTPDELQSAANDIIECLPAPRDVKLEEIPGNAEPYGHGDVFASLDKLCATWQLAIAELGMSAEQVAGALLSASHNYARGEDSTGWTFEHLQGQMDAAGTKDEEESWGGSASISRDGSFDGGRGSWNTYGNVTWGNGGEEGS